MEPFSKLQHELLRQVRGMAHFQPYPTLGQVQQNATNGRTISQLDLDSQIDIASVEFSVFRFHGSKAEIESGLRFGLPLYQRLSEYRFPRAKRDDY